MSTQTNPRLILVRGLPGSGKSYIARELQKSLPAGSTLMLDPDQIDLNSKEYAEHSKKLTEEGVEQKFHPFQFSRNKGFKAIDADQTIIWNQPFMDFGGIGRTIASLETYAADHGKKLRVLIVEVNVPVEVAHDRVKQRKAEGGHGPSPATFARSFSDIYKTYADISYPVITVNGEDDVSKSVSTITKALEGDMMKDEEKTLIVIRHLATPNNKNKVIMGRSGDVDIIEDEQIDEFKAKLTDLAEKLGITPDNATILASPLKRCMTTATIAHDTLGLHRHVVKVDDLIETDMGDFEGKTGDELRATTPDDLDRWMFTPEGFRFPNGESYDEVWARVNNVIDRAAKLEGTPFVIACTHVDLAKMFILKAEGKDFNQRRDIHFGNGNIAVLKVGVDKDGKSTIKLVDGTWGKK